MLSKVKAFLPNFIRIYLHQKQIRKKFDVILESGAIAPGTFFEGKNRLNVNAQVSKSHIGLGTYISGNSKLRNVQIGRFCSIGQNVETGFGIHPIHYLSTHPAFYSTQKQAGFSFVQEQLFAEHKFVDIHKKYFVSIGNDVWIGNNVKIMDGIEIGDGAIIGLGSIVTKDVKPYSIVGGIPAKMIRMRFDDKSIKKIIELQWWNTDIKELEKKANWFCSFMEDSNEL